MCEGSCNVWCVLVRRQRRGVTREAEVSANINYFTAHRFLQCSSNRTSLFFPLPLPSLCSHRCSRPFSPCWRLLVVNRSSFEQELPTISSGQRETDFRLRFLESVLVNIPTSSVRMLIIVCTHRWTSSVRGETTPSYGALGVFADFRLLPSLSTSGEPP